VLDIGTGTGVLAIIAARRGADYVLAFDNNEWAASNALENLQLNGAPGTVEIRQCELEDIRERDFDIVLANLHLNLIVRLLPEIIGRFVNGPNFLLTAGVLIKDYEWLQQQAGQHGFAPVAEERENEWIATLWTRTQ
jgi:ribosomal protein L11 methyltransferase